MVSIRIQRLVGGCVSVAFTFVSPFLWCAFIFMVLSRSLSVSSVFVSVIQRIRASKISFSFMFATEYDSKLLWILKAHEWPACMPAAHPKLWLPFARSFFTPRTLCPFASKSMEDTISEPRTRDPTFLFINNKEYRKTWPISWMDCDHTWGQKLSYFYSQRAKRSRKNCSGEATQHPHWKLFLKATRHCYEFELWLGKGLS